MVNKQGHSTQYAKGFTIAEVLVTLALTSLVITMSYATLNFVQKLLHGYRKQNTFLNEYTGLKERMDLEALTAKLVTEESTNSFNIERDSSVYQLVLEEKAILVKYNGHCDTFHIAAKNIKKEYEPMQHPTWQNKLLTHLQFEAEFTKQRFSFEFYKTYSAAVKLELNTKQQ